MSNTAVQKINTIDAMDNKYGIDVGKALKLRLDKNLSYNDIGKVFGVKKQAVQQRLKPFLALMDNPESTKAYESNKPQFLSSVERQLLVQLVDPKKLKDASLNNVAYSVAQVNNMNRLARGEATQNIDIRSLQLHSQNELEASVRAREELLKTLDVGENP